MKVSLYSEKKPSARASSVSLLLRLLGRRLNLFFPGLPPLEGDSSEELLLSSRFILTEWPADDPYDRIGPSFDSVPFPLSLTAFLQRTNT